MRNDGWWMVEASEIMEDGCQALPGHLPPLNPVSSQMPLNSLKQVSRSPQGEDGPVGPRTTSMGLKVRGGGRSGLNTMVGGPRRCSKHQAGVTRPIPGPLLLRVTFSKSQTLSTPPFTQNLIYFEIYLIPSRSRASLWIRSFISSIVN